MRIIKGLDNLPDFKDTVITIGSFDGVHLGHQKIIERINQIASETSGKSLIITFDPHPRSVIYPKDKSLSLLNSQVEKVALFEKFKVDYVVIVAFTVEFSQISAQEYVERFLISNFKPSHVVIGYDHRFGLNRQGNIDLLRAYEKEGKFKVEEISKKELEDITISSTQIRKALISGNLDQANILLNGCYRISGKVAHGQKLGTKLGYPTANLKLDNKYKLIPHNGIYAVRVFLDNTSFNGMLYIGDRPTIGDKLEQTIEVNIFDFNEDIYDKDIQLELTKYIRDDIKFNSLDELKNQLAIDELSVKNFFDLYSEPIVKSDTTVAILNYNGRSHLESNLSSVSFSSSNPFELCIVDNASSDDSIKYCEEWFPEIKVINLQKNYGFAEGYNKGVEQITTKYLVLLNSDVMVNEFWLDPLLKAMEADQSLAAVMPKIKSLEDNSMFEYAGAAGGYIDRFGYPFCKGRIFEKVESDQGQYDKESEIFWASGAAMVVRTSLFKQLGGFDSDFFAHMEEIDLCWRIKRAGFKIKMIPNSEIFHLGGGTLQYENEFKTKLNFRNNLSMIFKNERIGNLIWLLPVRLILDGIAGLKFLSQGNWKSCVAIIKAHVGFYAQIPNLVKKRKAVNELIKKYSIGPSNLTGKYKKSILFQYYILGKKLYSDIFQ